MLLINGEKIQTLSVMDRGLQFGDGCFTTAAIYHGKISMFSAHISRLRHACNKLNILFLHWKVLEEEMKKLACYQQNRAVLKVIITRGINERGYGYESLYNREPTRIVSISSWPSYYDYWRTHGIMLILSPIRLGRNPYLAGLKHLNRLEQVLISAYIKQADKADEALVLDSDGWIIECCSANIFWRKNNVVYTPNLNHAGVNGIMRQFCLHILMLSNFQVKEVYAPKQVLFEADEIIICNTLMPIVPVREYNGKKFFSRQLFNFLSPFCENPDSV